MEIEKVTPPNYFRNGYHKAAVNILYTCNWLQERIKLILDSEDITPQQYNILRILNYSGKPLSTLQIREKMLDKMSDTSRIVDRLVRKQVVNKVQAVKDKRLVDVTINDKGKQLLELLEKKNAEIDSILGTLTNKDTEVLNGLLDKIREKKK